MKKRLIAFGILMVCLMTLLPLSPVLAQGDATLELTTPYYKLEIVSGASVEFTIDLEYTGTEARVFDLVATGPTDWTTSITPSYPRDRQILDIRMEPPEEGESSTVQKIIVTATPASWLAPEVGEYPITLEASSGDIKSSIELTAVVTSVPATYTLYLTSPDGVLSTTAQAGKDNYFTLAVANSGTGAIDNISLSTNKPKGWTVELSQTNINSVAAGDYQTVEMNIKPPPDAISGDYELIVRASGTQASDSLEIRVTVKTSSLWGWVGIGIIVLVIAGLAVIFMRFSRR
ncbi:MAG: NEW3 domain-containing protein [Dehalococcoidales bacterium]|nr:NEW3 domain-containing protein [Dehalococcoidales bacterium]